MSKSRSDSDDTFKTVFKLIFTTMVSKTIPKNVPKKDRDFVAYTNTKFWKNEFPLLNETLKCQETSKQRVGTVLKEYARYCTLHGIQYVFKENSTFIERLVWFAIILTSFACASLLVNTMWTRFSTSPTMTAVKDTHLPLYSLPFPAISVCSADKIKREEAYHYLSEYVNLSDEDELQEVNNFLSAMSLFQLPLYSRMSVYLQNADSILPALARVNLTDFMLQVMPTCEEVFNRCFWIGKSTNCCEMFNLQRTEEGFCYSFNSLTSHFDENCNKIGDIGSYSEFSSIKACPLRRNAAAGSSSGLEIFLKSFNVSNRIINATDIVGIPGYKVQVFYVSEYPEAGMGNLIESKKGIKLALTIKPYVTISTQTIRKLDINDRFCYFPDEQKLSVSSSYSQKSCLIECRLGHLKKVCNCRPFFFNTEDNTVPVCNATQIHCIAEHNSELVFFSPPSVDIRGFNDSDLTSLLNCSQCLPTCHESIYDIDTVFTEDTLPLAQESYGGLDIFYRNEGAVKYQRDVTFGWEDLLVSFGGIAGLFLGFSLLSIVEFLYWSIKLTVHQISTYIQSRAVMIKSLKPRR